MRLETASWRLLQSTVKTFVVHGFSKINDFLICRRRHRKLTRRWNITISEVPITGFLLYLLHEVQKYACCYQLPKCANYQLGTNSVSPTRYFEYTYRFFFCLETLAIAMRFLSFETIDIFWSLTDCEAGVATTKAKCHFCPQNILMECNLSTAVELSCHCNNIGGRSTVFFLSFSIQRCIS